MDNELLLFDRINVIKDTITKYGEENFYLSFSGGKDSTILHYLLDMALPNNQIPRVFINTGIEYQMIVDFVKGLAAKDDRFIILQPTQAIKPMLEKHGYPFKSKEFARRVYDYNSVHGNIDRFIDMPTEEYKEYMLSHKEEEKQLVGKGIFIVNYLHGLRSKRDKNGYLVKYIDATKFKIPDKLRYLFSKDNKLKINNTCCLKLKKEPAHRYEKESGRTIVLTGMRRDEGGQRANIKGCILTDNKGNVKKFHPLLVVTDAWENWLIQEKKIELCPLYKEPYNFQRTGCKGCPFSLDLQEQLEIMELYLPNERRQCEMIWKPVYDEYRRLNYRLKKNEQIKLF